LLKDVVVAQPVGLQVTFPEPPVTVKLNETVSPELMLSAAVVFVAVTGAMLVVLVSVPVSATVMLLSQLASVAQLFEVL